MHPQFFYRIKRVFSNFKRKEVNPEHFILILFWGSRDTNYLCPRDTYYLCEGQIFVLVRRYARLLLTSVQEPRVFLVEDCL